MAEDIPHDTTLIKREEALFPVWRRKLPELYCMCGC